MKIDLFSFVDLYRRQLDTAGHLLSKGVEYAAVNGISEAEMLGWRLADDMQPLGFQLMVVINFAQGWTARVAGLPVPEPITADIDVAGFKAAIADAKAHLAALSPEQFADRDHAPITFKLGEVMEPTLPAGQWLSVFATTNITFHNSIIYALLRMKGVKIGKLDLFPSGL